MDQPPGSQPPNPNPHGAPPPEPGHGAPPPPPPPSPGAGSTPPPPPGFGPPPGTVNPPPGYGPQGDAPGGPPPGFPPPPPPGGQGYGAPPPPGGQGYGATPPPPPPGGTPPPPPPGGAPPPPGYGGQQPGYGPQPGYCQQGGYGGQQPGYGAPPPPPGYGQQPGYGGPGYGQQPPPPPPSRRGPAWLKIFGFGCLGCLLLTFIVFAWIGNQARDALKRTPLTDAQKVYAGSWTAPGGVKLTIREDGSGDLVDGGTTITNGRVTIDEGAKTLLVQLFGLKREWKIDSAPTAENRVMVLDGTEFRDTDSGSSTPGNSSETGNNSPPSDDDAGTSTDPLSQVPDEEQSGALAKESLLLFQQAVQAEDFSNLHANSSTALQKTYTPDALKSAFNVFLQRKELLDPITTMDPEVVTSEVTPEGQLKITGEYNVEPALNWEVSYTKEGGAWKLLGINVNRKL